MLWPNAETSTLTAEERLYGLDPEGANVLRRLGVAPTALAKSMVAAAEREPARHPELAATLGAIRFAKKDPVASLTFSFARGRPELVLRPGVLSR